MGLGVLGSYKSYGLVFGGCPGGSGVDVLLGYGVEGPGGLPKTMGWSSEGLLWAVALGSPQGRDVATWP